VFHELISGRESAGQSLAVKLGDLSVEDDVGSSSKPKISAFSALAAIQDDGPAAEDEDEDFGGLMVC
jgi:hypothetical protein